MTNPMPPRPDRDEFEDPGDLDGAPVIDRFDGEQFDLEERQALRRVAGLSTELQDITEVEYRQLRLERVVLVGVWTDGTLRDAENSLVELKLLAETAGSLVLDGLIQRRDKPDPATYIGSGKAKEVRDVVLATGADTVICDGELTPGQLRQLEEVVKVKVVDRTALILDIFAQHARSREGKAQVELAQMTYLLPRLRGWGESLSRQAGGRAAAGGVGIGGRGPGETKIELDRRRIRTRMSKLRRELAGMSTARDVKRQERRRGEVPSVAIAGYTNAGKSSLLNRLTGAGVLVENALFATLDPTVRRAQTTDGRLFTLTDTVGFVRHLPHQLIEAFRSTLEEVAEADLILHVVDGSDADPAAQLAAVRTVFGEIGALEVPELVVVNKADVAAPEVVDAIMRAEQRRGNRVVVVSARTGAGIDDLVTALDEAVPRPSVCMEVLLPFTQGRLVARVHDLGEVEIEEHTEHGTRLRARVPRRVAAELAEFVVSQA
jgi:GTPase